MHSIISVQASNCMVSITRHTTNTFQHKKLKVWRIVKLSILNLFKLEAKSSEQANEIQRIVHEIAQAVDPSKPRAAPQYSDSVCRLCSYNFQAFS